MTPQIAQPRRYPELTNRDLSSRIQPASAVALAIGLALAVFSEGRVPELWTKGLLVALIVPTIVTAMWLTGSRDGSVPGMDLDRRQA